MYTFYKEPINRTHITKLGGVAFNNWLSQNERKYREEFYSDNQTALTLPTFEDWVFKKYSSEVTTEKKTVNNFGNDMRKRMSK